MKMTQDEHTRDEVEVQWFRRIRIEIDMKYTISTSRSSSGRRKEGHSFMYSLASIKPVVLIHQYALASQSLHSTCSCNGKRSKVLCSRTTEEKQEAWRATCPSGLPVSHIPTAPMQLSSALPVPMHLPQMMVGLIKIIPNKCCVVSIPVH